MIAVVGILMIVVSLAGMYIAKLASKVEHLTYVNNRLKEELEKERNKKQLLKG